MISKNDYQKIINSLKVGNSVAEHDFILKDAMVDTPIFSAVLDDDYDIVTGRKGAGKTAIFRIIGKEKLDDLFLKEDLVVISGVNASSESIFAEFKKDFENFNEDDFENFWKIYFVSLAHNLFLKSQKYSNNLKNCQDEIEKFKKHANNAGIPDIPAQLSLKQILEWAVGVLKNIKRVKASLGANANTSLFGAELEFELKETAQTKIKKHTIYISEIASSLDLILKKSDLKLWIILDRLDEVFDRYSMVEFNGLRGLLKAYKSFGVVESSNRIRVKLFLRDDIKQFLTEEKSFKQYYPSQNIRPLVAATHIFAKESPVLNWSEDEIQQLILFRLLQSSQLRKFVDLKADSSFDIREKLRDKNLRIDIWNKIFPEKIVNSTSLHWIYNRLKDSNDVVTPRSVIDMLNEATEFQKKEISLNFEDKECVFPLEALKKGLEKASINKLENDIYNEFPKNQKYIEKLSRAGKHKLSKKDLQKIYGKDWEDIAEILRRIGILYFIKSSNDYRVVLLFRPALKISYKY